MREADKTAPCRRTAGAVRRRFLDELARTGSVRAAAAASGRARGAWVLARQADPELARDWDEALDSYVEWLEAEADRRAVSGEEEPVFYSGKQVGVRTRVSDSLLMFRLKALRPGRYGGVAAAADAGVVVEVRDFGADGKTAEEEGNA